MNTLLNRQIKKHLGNCENLPGNILAFLNIISDSYDYFEKDRNMLERCIDLTSKEMKELNNKLKTEIDQSQKVVFAKLKESLLLLNEQEDTVVDNNDYVKLEYMADILKNETQKRRLAEAEMEKANREFNTLFENMQEVFYSFDMKTFQMIHMSPACENVYGYSREAFIGNPGLWESLILEEDKARIEAKNKEMLTGMPIVINYRILGKKGEIKWLESRFNPTLDESGAVIRIDGLTSDITTNKEAEIALENNEHKFRSLIENSSDAVILVNANIETLFGSNSLYRIMGYYSGDIIGEGLIRYIHKNDLPALSRQFECLLEMPGQTINIIFRGVKSDRSFIWCEGTATNLLNDPAVNGIVINFRDITERKVAKDALLASNEELKKSNNELDRFVYSVSHDLRAPLSSMLGVIGLMEMDTTDTNISGDLNRLKSSVNKLDGFISDILDYSRNARLDVKAKAVCFKELVDDAVSNLRYMHSGNKNIDIQVQVDTGVPFYSDKSRISIILNNLVSNALRYSNPNTADPFVSISIIINEEVAEIRIKDNGIGISAENLAKVFDIFYRVSKKSVGSGLGLYIVKEAVEKLKGSINLISELNKGSEFSIFLPNLKHE